MKKNYQTAKNIALAMEHELYNIGDAYHEMWNGWVCALDPYDMAEAIEQEKITIIGYFTLSEPIRNKLDIGVVAEAFNGERFWCHARKQWFEDWKIDYPELYI